MTSTLTTPVLKEKIGTLIFSKSQNYQSNDNHHRLEVNAHLGMLLGNNFHQKVKIVFNTSNGLKEVETTIWAATRENIILKGGAFIPKNSIQEIRLN